MQSLYLQQRAYASKRNHALANIREHSDDEQTALSLLQTFWHQYKHDIGIYSDVKDISRQLGALDILRESTRKALMRDRLAARSHYDFMINFPEDSRYLIITNYVHCINESQLCPNITSNIDVSLNKIDGYLESRADLTNSARDYMTLGNFRVFSHSFEKAEKAYRQAIMDRNESVYAYSNLSFVLKLRGCLKESHTAMGESRFIRGEFDLAAGEFMRARLLGESSNYVCERLAQSYANERRYIETVAVCVEAADKKGTARLYALWIDALRALNRIDEALEIADRGCKAFPNEHYFKFQGRLILPVIYRSEDDIAHHRIRFERTLRSWSIKCSNDARYAVNAINDLKATNFYLPYQGNCDIRIQKEYGALINRIVSATHSSLSSIRQSGRNADRIRIGYVSAFFSWHTVGKLFLGWLEHHDKKKFETHVYHLGREMDFMSFKFQAACARFTHFGNGNFLEICKRIRSDSPDILVYLEYGMDVTTSKIAALRLAPVQCLAWGHPVTSGLPTMDYFISSALMEPPDGDAHYSEVLVKLPNIGVCVPRASTSISTKARNDFGLADNYTIYVFPHSLFKALPRYDEVFACIAKGNKKSQFVFIERDTHSIEVAQIYKERLSKVFERHHLDPSDHIRFVPQLSTQNFLRLLSLADVYLDSIGWSGGMTTLEALACTLPVVTMPGEFMRGRHSYGCLRRIGVNETVAQTVEDYIDIAVRLGLDDKWRGGIKVKQATGLERLYDDIDCVSELEQFYQTVLRS